MDEQDDVTIEPENGSGEGRTDDAESLEGKAEDKIAKMREELSACRKEKQEYMDGWQRSKADYVNLLRRIEEPAKAAESSGKVKAVETLLPAFDALERAKEHLPRVGSDKAGGEAVEGFMAIAKQLESAFATLGVEAVGEIGEKFDPAFHEALGQDAVSSVEADDSITAVLEKGWKIRENVIRPAKVRVAHYSAEA